MAMTDVATEEVLSSPMLLFYRSSIFKVAEYALAFSIRDCNCS